MDCPVEGQLQCSPVERPGLAAASAVLFINMAWIIARLRSAGPRPVVLFVVVVASWWETHIAACLDDIVANLQYVGLVSFACDLWLVRCVHAVRCRVRVVGNRAGETSQYYVVVVRFDVASVRWNFVVAAGGGALELIGALVPGV